MGELDVILDKVLLFEKMYDSMRIVDPVKKETLEIKEGLLCKKESKCYKLLNKQAICENCISIRACSENETIIKIEYHGNKVYMITAVPVSIQGKKFAVELFKDATNSIYLKNMEPGCEMKILSAIKHMNQAAIKDELTGLYNRRFIEERLPADLLNASLRNESLSIIFADLDFFKAVNDTYGHLAGDQVLRELAEELKRHIRKERDWVARYGGEEFIICLSDTDMNSARVIAERIRKGIMEKVFIIDNDRIHLTGSFGVHAVCSGDKCLTADEIIEIADKNLYHAKAEGRNRVV